MNPAIALPEAPARRRRGRWQLILLIAVAVGPMLLASGMYHWRFWVPDGRSYHGELIGNGLGRTDIGVTAADEHLWQLLVTAPQDCAQECQQLVYLARQIHIGLGREASRAGHALANARPLDDDFATRLEREYPQLQRYGLDADAYARGTHDLGGAQLWIVDPHGNLVLRYDAKANGKQILNDLRHLLKLSKIG